MIDIRTINSEVDIQEECTKNFKKKRIIDQTALYLGTCANNYYNPNTAFSAQYDYPRLIQLLTNTLSEKKDLSVAIISLGCGSCEKEKPILDHLKKVGYNISFFGVDSSMAMIKKAARVLNNATFEPHLICADFGGLNFKKELNKIIGDYSVKMYMFFGNTFGNLNQSYVTDVLKNIMRTGDYLLLDIVGVEAVTPLMRSKLFERYVKFIEHPPEKRFFFGPAKALGIPEDCGEMALEVNTDHTTQALIFRFKFKINRSVKFNIEQEEVNLSTNEYIHLCDILVYDINELIKFLKKRSFKLEEQILGYPWNQLLLQRQ